MKKKGTLFIISGPSQVGKDSVITAIKKIRSLNLKSIVTNTTRPRRPGEKNGQQLNFLTDKQFNKLINTNQLLEWACVRGYKFGTPKKEILSALNKGYNVIINVDVQGAIKINKLINNCILIFITAESPAEIKKRIYASYKMTAKQKAYRWQEAKKELKAMKLYDYIVINRWQKLPETVNKVVKIIKKHIENRA